MAISLKRWFWMLFGAAGAWFAAGSWISPYKVTPGDDPRFLQRIHEGIGGIVRGALITQPFTWTQRQIVNLAPAVDTGGQTMEQLADENRQLRAELDRLHEQFKEAVEAARAKDLVIKAWGIDPKALLQATIKSGSVSSSSDSFTIDQGSNSGVKVGMPVVCEAWLVGRVISVDRGQSDVALLTDANQFRAIGAQLVRKASGKEQETVDCILRGAGNGTILCDSIGQAMTIGNATRLIGPPAEGDVIRLYDPKNWPGAVQFSEIGVVTSWEKPGLKYVIKIAPSVNVFRHKSVTVLLKE